MASFGSFETGREIYSGAAYTVYGAKKSGDPKTEYAVKVFHIRVDDTSAGDLDTLLRDLERSCADRIAVQQKTAAQSAFIAPVVETGQDERGVWYATYFYPFSVNRLILGKVNLKGPDLEQIIRAIVKGALDLKRVCGRVHGDISPSAVHISRTTDITRASIVLSDPLPGGESQAANFELSDLRAIGRIFLQLVLRREITREEDFHLLAQDFSPQWTEVFGDDAKARWTLCKRLLDPQLSVDQFNLEQLDAELAPRKKEFPWKLVAAAAMVLVLGGVAAFFLLRTPQQTVEVTTDPPGARILVDGQESKPPLKLKRKPGAYVITATLPDYKLPDQSTNWTVGPEKTARLDFKFPYGAISIISDPPGADIQDILDPNQPPKSIHTAPYVMPVVPGGTQFKYQLALAQHVTNFVSGTVTNGQTNSFSVKLDREIDTLFVTLESSPSGAEVFEGDKLLSPNPTTTRARLTDGRHNINARFRDGRYMDWPSVTNSVDVKKGADNRFRIDFPRGWLVVDTVSTIPGVPAPKGKVVVGTNEIGDTGEVLARPLGTTVVTLKAGGFKTTNFPVVISRDATNYVKREMFTENALVEFTSDPADAIIFDSNNKEIGRTAKDQPFRTNLPPDSYSFIARHEGLADVSFPNVRLEKGQTVSHKFTFAYARVTFDVSFGASPADVVVSALGRRGKANEAFIQPPSTNVIYEVSARYYLPTNVPVKLDDHRDEHIAVKLLPEPTPVTLTSQPPGAKFFANGALLGQSNQYRIPWGPITFVANYGRLGSRTNQTEIQAGQPNNIPAFMFDYGTLFLTNMPGDLGLTEGNTTVVAGGQGRPALIYEPLGSHTYRFTPLDRFKPEQITTNVHAGQNFLIAPEIKGFVSGVASIPFAWIPSPNGGAWEGKPEKGFWAGIYEVTQDQYKALMGNNPSAFQTADTGNYPVESVTWEQAASFCEALSSKDSRKPANWKYALPTDEMFNLYSVGATEAGVVMTTSANRRSHPEPVGSTGMPSPLGLYDVVGNVSEWLDTGDKSAKGASFKNFTPQSRLQTMRGTAVSSGFGFRVVLIPAQ
jgi:hypothetical protein